MWPPGLLGFVVGFLCVCVFLTYHVNFHIEIKYPGTCIVRFRQLAYCAIPSIAIAAGNIHKTNTCKVTFLMHNLMFILKGYFEI